MTNNPYGQQGPTWSQPQSGSFNQPAWRPPTGQPSWGPPTQQPGGFGYPPPPKKKSNTGKMLLAGVGVVLALALGGALLSAILGSGTTAGGYVNESYQAPPPDMNPPDLPPVTDEKQATGLLLDNPLYKQAIPGPTRCQIDTINLTSASDSQLTAHMNDLMVCLMRVWDGPIRDAGFEMPRPPISVYSAPITTSCGKTGTRNAFYCSGDQRIYYARDLPSVIPSAIRDSRFIIEMVVAHEFAHAIQARTGIFVSSYALGKMSGSKAGENLYSRRSEVQADCFAGLFLRSVSQSAGMTEQELANVSALSRAIGDDTLSGKPNIEGNHGLARSRQYWTEMGLASTNAGVCNTFAAPESTVR